MITTGVKEIVLHFNATIHKSRFESKSPTYEINNNQQAVVLNGRSVVVYLGEGRTKARICHLQTNVLHLESIWSLLKNRMTQVRSCMVNDTDM